MRDRAVEHLPVRKGRTIFDDATYHAAERCSVAEVFRQVCLHEPEDEIHLSDINRLARHELTKLRDRQRNAEAYIVNGAVPSRARERTASIGVSNRRCAVVR